MRIRPVFAALLFAVLAPLATAQDLVAIVARDLSSGAGQESVGSLLALRLGVELESRGYQLADMGDEAIAAGDTADPRVSTLDLDNLPEEADLLVVAFYRVDGSSIVIQFVLVDPVVDIVVGGVLTRQRAGFNTSAAIVSAIGDLQPALERWENDRSLLRTGPPPDTVERLIVTGSQEDVRVRFAELEVGRIRGGRIVVPYSPFPVGATVPMTLSRPGYHDREVTVVLDAPFVETPLPRLFPASSVGLSLLWTSSYVRGAGVGLRFYPAADLFYLLGEYYHFANPASGGRAIRVGDARLAGGLYVLAPESVLRFFAELGGGMILTDVDADSGGRLSDEPIYRDLFVGISVGIEANLGRWKPFLRADVDYALGVTRYNLLGNRWVSAPLTSLPFPVPMATIGVQHTW
jgi:hypothetical protein